MGAIADILLVEGNLAKRRITDNMERQGRNASYATVKGIKVYATESQLLLIDTEGTLLYNEDGRKPGGQLSSQFITALEKWSLKKGIGGKLSQQRRRSLAWAIGKSIIKKGTRLYQRGGNSGVVSDAINQQFIDELLDKLAPAYTSIIKTQIIKAL